MMVQISLAQHDDVAPWLRLAEDVVPLFGPMPDFDAVLVRKIAQQRAFSARTDIGSAGFIGGVLMGGSDLKHAIRWLAVSSEFRRLGVGKMLVETALSSIPPDSTVHVDTFVAVVQERKQQSDSMRDAASFHWKSGERVRWFANGIFDHR
ncbi:GNAT family N-acetyltransferase [Rhizobium leguminosarum]|uniref:GNAT family N-acetyltransferase n=1 Tax=Rhizobium leguminosarum TaxID=384 RepID=UPI00102FB92C|nr:GNAT family N-acetyltransferase [Rhizobium leguminosarum]TAV74762.1 GNAT family N-acetyltransferase [Rhizobium leguminosarum]TAV79361.1 GNAT family N-acetyltransferase [Rhizobium leguminosarum]